MRALSTIVASGICVVCFMGCGSDDSEASSDGGGTAGMGGAGGGSGGAAGAGGSGASAGAAGVSGSGGAGGASTCDNDGTAWDPAWQTIECETIAVINAKRAAGITCGAQPFPPVAALPRHQLLTDIARAHAKDMAENGYIGYTNSKGEGLQEWLVSGGFTGALPGVSLGSGQADATSVIDALLQGTGTCENFPVAAADKIAVGYYRKDGSQFTHYWVFLLGSGG